MYNRAIQWLTKLRDKVSVAYTLNSQFWLYASIVLFICWFTYMERPA